jgi:hypothetical protein
MSDEHTEVSDATRNAEADEAQMGPVAGPPATPEEEEAVDDHPVDPEVRAHYREMTELGAEDRGEGRIP